jgi:hypothetical protein
MTPTAEQRERDRKRYANMTPEQHAARLEANREAKARRARERWAKMTAEEKAARLAQIREGEKAVKWSGDGIDEAIGPLVHYCPSCGARRLEAGYCDFICAHNHQAARPVRSPEPFIYAREGRRTR